MTTHYQVSTEVKTLAQNALTDALAFVDIATDFEVKTAEDAELAGEQLSAINKAMKQYNTLRLEHTRPVDQLKKDIMSEFNEPVAKLEQANKLLRGELSTWTIEQERLAREERDREQQRIAREREAAAKALADEQARAAKLVQPAAIERAAERVEAATSALDEVECTTAIVAKPAAVKGFGMRNNWQPEYSDASLEELVCAASKDKRLLRYLDFNTVNINKTVKAMEGATDIPGVRAVNNRTTAVR